MLKRQGDLQGKLTCEIKKYREKRSLNANAYLWVLCDKIARKLSSSKDEIYENLIISYGVFSYYPVPVKEVDSFSSLFRVVEDRGDVILTNESGKEVKCKRLQCYKGSSAYDTKEMAHLLDGAIHEAEILGISTITQDEVNKMKEVWGVEEN